MVHEVGSVSNIFKHCSIQIWINYHELDPMWGIGVWRGLGGV